MIEQIALDAFVDALRDELTGRAPATPDLSPAALEIALVIARQNKVLSLVQERLRSRLEHGFQSSLTSREILRRARLPGEAQTAFAGLVAAVEITLFGQHAANLATYELCRENSRRVLAAAV